MNIARFLIIAVAISVAIPGAVLAQSANRPICAEREIIVSTLASRYGEAPVSAGLGAGNRVVEVFASEETGTWTITVTSVNGTTCLVASGDSYTALAQGPEGEAL